MRKFIRNKENALKTLGKRIMAASATVLFGVLLIGCGGRGKGTEVHIYHPACVGSRNKRCFFQITHSPFLRFSSL